VSKNLRVTRRLTAMLAATLFGDCAKLRIFFHFERQENNEYSPDFNETKEVNTNAEVDAGFDENREAGINLDAESNNDDNGVFGAAFHDTLGPQSKFPRS
jgi:hypothetical protein